VYQNLADVNGPQTDICYALGEVAISGSGTRAPGHQMLCKVHLRRAAVMDVEEVAFGVYSLVVYIS